MINPDPNRTLTVNYWQLIRMLENAWSSGYIVADDEFMNLASGSSYDPKLNMNTKQRKEDDVLYCLGVLSGQLKE